MREILMSALGLLLTTTALLADECGVLCEVDWWETATEEEISTAVEAADPNSWGRIGVPLLNFVVVLGTPENIDALIKAGADPNAVGRDGRSALHAAAYGSVPEVISIFLAAGADASITRKSGKQLLILHNG